MHHFTYLHAYLKAPQHRTCGHAHGAHNQGLGYLFEHALWSTRLRQELL